MKQLPDAGWRIISSPEPPNEKRLPGLVASGRQGLYGQSLGGHLAVAGAAAHPGKIDALVIEGAFSSHEAMAAHRRGAPGRAFVSEPYSALQSIGDYAGPILVIHSRDEPAQIVH